MKWQWGKEPLITTCLVCRILTRNAVQSDLHSTIAQAVANAFTETNRRFLEVAEREGLADGTTAVVAVGFGGKPFPPFSTIHYHIRPTGCQ